MNITEVNFSKISSDPFLRTDVDHYIIKDNLNKFISQIGMRFFPLAYHIETMVTGDPIERADYSAEETPYIHLVVRNIKNGELVLNNPIYLNEDKAEELSSSKISSGDIVLAISSNVGDCFYYADQYPDIQLTLSHYLVKFRVNEEAINRKFLIYYLNTEVIKSYFRACETGKDLKNLSKRYLRKVPFPDITREQQDKVTKLIFEKVEQKLVALKSKFRLLQDAIDEVFLNYKVKSVRPPNGKMKQFHSTFADISSNPFLRTGVSYRYFWKTLEGKLFFNGSEYPVVKLKELIKPAEKQVLKKGVLDQPYHLIDLDNIEPKTGNIIEDEVNVVNEIGSDKVVFGNSDILISKIDPYLGYVLLNDPSIPYIGTSELLPFNVKETNDKRYVKYLLLTNEFLQISKYLMYGKRHPRMHQLDLLNIKVPKPPYEVQKEMADQIEIVEQSNRKIQKEMAELDGMTDRLLWDYVCDISRAKDTKETTGNF